MADPKSKCEHDIQYPAQERYAAADMCLARTMSDFAEAEREAQQVARDIQSINAMRKRALMQSRIALARFKIVHDLPYQASQ